MNHARLLTTIWQRKDVWKTLFQNKSSGTINPAYLPLELLKNTKNVSINKTLSITTLAQYIYPATLEEHPINNYDPDRVLFWKTCTGKKCINVYTLDLGVKWYQKASSWATSETYTCFKKQSTLELRQVLTGAVLLKLPHPNGFGLGFSSTLQGARLESLMRERSWLIAPKTASTYKCECTRKKVQIALASWNSTNTWKLDQSLGLKY